MRKSRFTEAQIVEILRAINPGTLAEELTLCNDIHADTIRLSRSKLSGNQSEARGQAGHRAIGCAGTTANWNRTRVSGSRPLPSNTR